MNTPSQSGENSEVKYPAPQSDIQNVSDSNKWPDNNPGGSAMEQIPEQQEDSIPEEDKMLLDYALLTSLY